LVEPDAELARIVAFELQKALRLPVKTCDPRDLGGSKCDGAVPVVLPSKAKLVGNSLPEGMELIVLQIRSVPSALAKARPNRSAAPPGANVTTSFTGRAG